MDWRNSTDLCELLRDVSGVFDLQHKTNRLPNLKGGTARIF